MEVKYTNFKVENVGYNPTKKSRRNSFKRPPRNSFSSYNTKIANKKPYALVLVVAIIVLLAGVTIWNAFLPKLDPVENLKSSKITQNGVTLKWKKVSDAQGYVIYKKTSDEGNFEKIGSVKNATKYTVKKLKSQTDYTLCVSAYRNNVESKKSTVDIFTLPKSPEFTLCNSKKKGTISLSWDKVKNAKNYEIQYVKGTDKNFKDAKTEKVKQKKNPSLELKGLDKSGAYSVRIRTTIKRGEGTVTGKWSNASITYIAKDFVLRSNLDPSKPMVALTFDDGPGYNDASDKILDTLEKYDAKATFFMIGKNAKDHPDNIKRKANLGMELANHSWNHVHYGENVTVSDIKKASDAIHKICGQYPNSFRSPGGMTTDLIRKECKKENMPLYYWSIDTQDWMSRDCDKIYNAVMDNVEDGDIVLMHEIYTPTAEAVEKMVPKLIKKGYQLVTCEELMYAKTGKAPKPGVQYMSAN
ncbi:MAG: polysaccharide deacetylase family protein [Ruminococcus sp.]|nr:polysaccharide deacetylase family protein [Ruminococcus sp.]